MLDQLGERLLGELGLGPQMVQDLVGTVSRVVLG